MSDILQLVEQREHDVVQREGERCADYLDTLAEKYRNRMRGHDEHDFNTLCEVRIVDVLASTATLIRRGRHREQSWHMEL